MKQIIDGKLYDTDKADLVASNRFWDGSSWERNRGNTYLYKTAQGDFFVYRATRWRGERDIINALTVKQAKELYELLPKAEMGYSEAFGE